MASSGTITESIRTGYQLKVVWNVDSQSVANNTSSVTVKVQLVSTGSSYTINSSASKSGSVTINGTKYTFSFTASLSGNQTKTIFSKPVTIAHAANGTKTCSFSATCGINVTLSDTYYGNVTATGTGTFDTIARASTISSVTSSVSVNGTNEVTVAITRAASSFTHTVVFSFGTYSKTTTGVGTSTSYAIPTSWLSAIPSATSGTAKVTVTTYSGSTKIGSSVSKNFTLTVPSTVVPTIGSVTVADTTTNQTTYGNMVQSKSKPKFTITASGALGSTITAYKTVFEGKTYTGATPTASVITGSGSVKATITVTDSRGRTASTTKTWTVVAYTAPKIISFQGFRCLADGTENYDGTHVKMAVNFSISPISDKNTKAYTIEYKLQSATTWTALTSGSVYALNTSLVSASGPFGVDNSFDIRLTVTDAFTTVRSTFEIPTAFTLIDFNKSGRGIAFGKVSEVDNGIEVNLPMSVYEYIYMGGIKKTDEEKDIYFQTSDNATNVHNCKLYGASGDSVTSIGCWDTARSHGIWRYLSGTQNLVFDANVKVTRANGGDEFITSGDVTHGNRTGWVRFSNGLLIQWGNVTITPVANTPTAKAVTFHTPYTDAPVVLSTAYTTVPGTSVLGDGTANITTTGFDAYVTRTGTTNTGIMWLAIGYKA
ncbi:MAG: hypothetical protein J6V25_01890 [Oscillospiraceae bacterium]|nr:hypothetical protein [Oscillospiraceae bacterium]